MSSPDQRSFADGDSSQDRELDRLLTWGVKQLAGSAEPSPRVWQHIEQQLRGGPPPRRQPPPRGPRRTAPVAQALAVASLLLVVGLSVWPMLQWPSYVNGSGEPVEMITRTPNVVPYVEIGDNTLPLKADEGMLSLRQTMLWEQEQQRQLLTIARDTSPAKDPILKHRRQARVAE